MNGNMQDTEAKNDREIVSMVCGRNYERQGTRERTVGKKSTGTCLKNGRGKRREGGPVRDRLKKEGRLDRNWKNHERGGKTKLLN